MLKNKSFILYAAALAAICLLLRWMDYRLLIIDLAYEVYMGALALIFTLLGIWIALKLSRPKIETVVVEKEVFIQSPQTLRDVTPVELSYETLSGDSQADKAPLFNPNVEGQVLTQRPGENFNLSKRELEVLELMSQGLSNKEISDKLFVSLNTVKTHTSKLFEKMDVRRRTQAVDLARRYRMID